MYGIEHSNLKSNEIHINELNSFLTPSYIHKYVHIYNVFRMGLIE